MGLSKWSAMEAPKSFSFKSYKPKHFDAMGKPKLIATPSLCIFFPDLFLKRTCRCLFSTFFQVDHDLDRLVWSGCQEIQIYEGFWTPHNTARHFLKQSQTCFSRKHNWRKLELPGYRSRSISDTPSNLDRWDQTSLTRNLLWSSSRALSPLGSNTLSPSDVMRNFTRSPCSFPLVDLAWQMTQRSPNNNRKIQSRIILHLGWMKTLLKRQKMLTSCCQVVTEKQAGK